MKLGLPVSKSIPHDGKFSLEGRTIKLIDESDGTPDVK